MQGEARFGAEERLRRGADFERAFKKGVRLDGRLFLLVASGNGTQRSRLGLAAGRVLGSAVARNRARRLAREAFRRNKSAMAAGQDIVLVLRRDILGCGLKDVEHEYRERLRKLAARKRLR